MRSYSLGYLLERTFKGLARNGFMSFASILILSSCLLVSGSFGMLIYNIYLNFNNLNELNEIVCICKYDVTSEQLADVTSRLKALEGVESVTLKTKEEAIDELKDQFSGYPQIFERITAGDNPLPDVFTVKYTDSSVAVNLSFTLKAYDEFKSVDDKIDVANTLDNLKSTILWVFISFMLVLFVISIIIIMNTVSLAVNSRSKEIIVMRYVGATNWFITFPFYVETLIVGLISTAVAFGLQFLSYDYLFKLINTDTDLTPLIYIVPFSDIWWWVLPAFLIVAAITCFIGTAISLAKHITV